MGRHARIHAEVIIGTIGVAFIAEAIMYWQGISLLDGLALNAEIMTATTAFRYWLRYVFAGAEKNGG
jgi:hypothetical protein